MQKKYSTNFSLASIDAALLILRLGVGILMLTHGYPKLLILFGSEEINFADPFGLGPAVTLSLAVIAEFLCSILVILGLGTRLAVLPLIATMATAFFLIHAADSFPNKELPAIYLLIYIVLLITGAGKYALDFYWLKRKNRR
jgi:putative oxidoreductase